MICVSDEVYEWIDYGETELVRICSLPGMWERTITIGSAGKTFSVTGWRTGWAYGSAALIKNMILVHTNVVYACPTPLQVFYFKDIWILFISHTIYRYRFHRKPLELYSNEKFSGLVHRRVFSKLCLLI